MFFYGRIVVCANEWGRWSVHGQAGKKSRVVRMRGDKVKEALRSFCLIGQAS